MCYAIPGRITAIKDDVAKVDYGGVMKEANISLIESPIEGDYILVHAGFAIEKLKRRTAEESLKIINQEIERKKNG